MEKNFKRKDIWKFSKEKYLTENYFNFDGQTFIIKSKTSITPNKDYKEYISQLNNLNLFLFNSNVFKFWFWNKIKIKLIISKE